MDQSIAVWTLIGLSLVCANLPFVLDRRMIALPWTLSGQPARPWWRRWVESLVFFVLLSAAGYAALQWIGGGFMGGGGIGAALVFIAKVLIVASVCAALLWLPGWQDRGFPVQKSFFDRLLEVLVFYGLVGVLGFSFEANIGNPFPQGWEFYAVTLSLFLVLGYPGFVYRYLLRRRKPAARKAESGRSAQSARPLSL